MAKRVERRPPQSTAPTRPRREPDPVAPAVRRLHEQAESLGIFDPLDAEPALVFDPDECEI
jgi:hypothetical protein